MTDPNDDEALLARLRDWLRETRLEAEGAIAAPPEAPSVGLGVPEVGLYRLVEEFTALRHEVKLQTKGGRDLHAQVEALLPAFRQAIEQFRGVEPKQRQAAFEAARPLAEALADLDEALERGCLEMEKARGWLIDEPARALEAAIDELLSLRSWLGRRRLRSYHEDVRAVIRRRDGWVRPELLDALIEGIALIQGRLRRVMEAEQIRRIETEGQPADPERMTVIEVVDAPDVPPGVVVDEVRRGYTWRGRVLRFAEVRAARFARPSPDGGDGENGRPLQD